MLSVEVEVSSQLTLSPAAGVLLHTGAACTLAAPNVTRISTKMKLSLRLVAIHPPCDVRVRYIHVVGVGMSADNAFGSWSRRHDCAVLNSNPHLTLVRHRIGGTIAAGENLARRITSVTGPRQLAVLESEIQGV